MRNLILRSGNWKYKVGRDYTVIRNPDRKAHLVKNHILAGISEQGWDNLDCSVPIKPRIVRAYIEDNLVK